MADNQNNGGGQYGGNGGQNGGQNGGSVRYIDPNGRRQRGYYPGDETEMHLRSGKRPGGENEQPRQMGYMSQSIMSGKQWEIPDELDEPLQMLLVNLKIFQCYRKMSERKDRNTYDKLSLYSLKQAFAALNEFIQVLRSSLNDEQEQELQKFFRQALED